MAPLTIGTAAMTATRMYSSSRLGPPGTNQGLVETRPDEQRVDDTDRRGQHDEGDHDGPPGPGTAGTAVSPGGRLSRPTRPRGSAIVMPSTIAPSRAPAPPLKSQVNALRQLSLTAISFSC